MYFVALATPTTAEPVPLTPESAISTTRIMGSIQKVVISPNGMRYAFMLLTGDVENDGNWMTVMAGRLDSLETAEPKVVGRLFGRSLGRKGDWMKAYLTQFASLVWIDDENLAFFWEDSNGYAQVFMADTQSESISQLTDHKTSLSIMTLGVNENFDLIYSALATKRAQVKEDYDKMTYEGFAVDHTDALSVQYLPSGLSERDIQWGYNWFHKSINKPAYQLSINERLTTKFLPFTGATISPDGRFAIVTGFPMTVSPEWLNYTSMWVSGVEKALNGNDDDLIARQLQQLYVLDLKKKNSRPLWNALTMSRGTRFAWSSDGDNILVGPTFLPPGSASEAGLSGNALAEIDIFSGEYWEIPIESVGGHKVQQLRWISRSTVEVTTEGGVFSFTKRADGWKLLSPHTEPLLSTPYVKIETRTSLNSPTFLEAIDTRTGEQRIVFKLNPGLTSKYKFGRVEIVEWKSEDGRRWRGELYLPADYIRGEQYPFVLQTHGGTSSFSIYGYPDYAGSGPGAGVYIAQLLAGRGVGVLQIRDQNGVSRGEYAETYLHGYEAAVQFLLDRGVADPDKIGLQGFSRTGWAAQYTLANSSIEFAAAIAADNVEAGYVENVLLPAEFMTPEIGALPFGSEGMKRWLETAPPFNAERIRTPLLKIQQDSGSITGIGSSWELFTRLRRLQMPVELYIMPDAEEHGAHNPQNPRQVAALQNRALDWWLFWLKGEEDPSPAKVEQYARWRELLHQRDEVLKHPRPPKLRWTATPIADDQHENP